MYVKVKSRSRARLFATPWTVAHQAPLSVGFSRQEYWSGLQFPSPGDLLDPGIKPGSAHCRQTLLLSDTGLEEAQAGIKIAGRNINNFRYADDTTLMAESEEELKSLLMKVIEESLLA